MIQVREAVASDAAGIREIFLASYGTEYTDPRFYDEQLLLRLIYSEHCLLLVAEDTDRFQLLGTASVEFEVGAHSDLVGEFCRLAVHPRARGKGLGSLLMTERLRMVQDRLLVGIVEARVAHPFSLKIAQSHQFALVGFLPQRWRMGDGESLAVLTRFFGPALDLRRNHPRMIPEVSPLASLALQNCGLASDGIVDGDSASYPPGGDYQLQDLTTEGYAALLRIERGRVRHREIFGPSRLHYGIFRLHARHSRYLIARSNGLIAGAVGFTVDPIDQSVRVFELISLSDDVIRYLLQQLLALSDERWKGVIEVDVSANAPRMQRTLLELGFHPVAYLPSLVFDDVERLDVVRMMRLTQVPPVVTAGLEPGCRQLAELVMRPFRQADVPSAMATLIGPLQLFSGLSAQQFELLAGVCRIAEFAPGAILFRAGDAGGELHVLLDGEVAISSAQGSPLATVRRGESLAETSLLAEGTHSATATAATPVRTAVFNRTDLSELIRMRPDIGIEVYRNLATGLGQKLRRSD